MPFMCVLRLDLEHRPWTHGKTLAGWTPQCGPRFHGPQPQPAPGLKSSASSSQRAAELESGTEEFLFSPSLFFLPLLFSPTSLFWVLPISVCLFGENVYTELNLTSLLPKALFMPLNFIPSLSRSIPTRPPVRLLAFTKKNFSWQKNDIKLNPLESSDETRDTRHVRWGLASERWEEG